MQSNQYLTSICNRNIFTKIVRNKLKGCVENLQKLAITLSTEQLGKTSFVPQIDSQKGVRLRD